MGKEYVVERQRIERERMRNDWFYVTSLVAAAAIFSWIVGGGLLVLLALLLILGLNIALPMMTYLRLNRALARDRAKNEKKILVA